MYVGASGLSVGKDFYVTLQSFEAAFRGPPPKPTTRSVAALCLKVQWTLLYMYGAWSKTGRSWANGNATYIAVLQSLTLR